MFSSCYFSYSRTLVDEVTSGAVVFSKDETVVVVAGEVPVVFDSTEVGGCVTTDV